MEKKLNLAVNVKHYQDGMYIKEILSEILLHVLVGVIQNNTIFFNLLS